MTRLRDFLLEPPAPSREMPRGEPAAALGREMPRAEPAAARSRQMPRGEPAAATAPGGRPFLETLRAVFFGERSAPGAATPSAAAALAPAVAVVGAGGDAAAVAAALALALARGRRQPAALVCLGGTGTPPWRAPAVPPARRLCATLRARGLQAVPTGRLALAVLTDDPLTAAAEATRALATAGAGVPAVLALGGVRTAAFDELLGSVDLAVAAVPATAPGSLAWLAVAGLGAVAPRALQAIAPAPGPARALALAGVLAAPGLRTSVAAAAEAIAR